MDKNLKIYTTPLTEVLEMQVEQVLAASGGTYPQFEEEFGW